MTPRPVLYTFRRCPYAMRARWAVQVSALDVELREITLRAKPAAMQARRRHPLTPARPFSPRRSTTR